MPGSTTRGPRGESIHHAPPASTTRPSAATPASARRLTRSSVGGGERGRAPHAKAGDERGAAGERESGHRDRERARAEGEVEGSVEAAAAGADEGRDEGARRARVAADRVVAEAGDEEVALGAEGQRRGPAETAGSARDERREEGARRRVEGLHLAREVRRDVQLPLVEHEAVGIDGPAAIAAGVDEDAEELARRAVVPEHLAGGARHVEVLIGSEGEAARREEAARAAEHERAERLARRGIDARDPVVARAGDVAAAIRSERDVHREEVADALRSCAAARP